MKKIRQQESLIWKSLLKECSCKQEKFLNEFSKLNPEVSPSEIKRLMRFITEFLILIKFLESLREINNEDTELITTFDQDLELDVHHDKWLNLLYDVTKFETVESFIDWLSKSSANPRIIPTLFLWKERFQQDFNWKHFPQMKISKKFLKELSELFQHWNWEVREYRGQLKKNTITPAIFGFLLEYQYSHPESKKKTGKYYTPRFICDFMSTLSLLAWSVASDDDQKPIITKKELTTILEKTDKLFSSQIYQVHSILNEKDNHQSRKNPLVLDNSCGSGEFLLSMLEALTTAKKIELKQLQRMPTMSTTDQIKAFLLKYQIYGSDIDYKGVATTRLRLWLSYLGENPHHVDLNLFIMLFLNIREGNSLVGMVDLDHRGELLQHEDKDWNDNFTRLITIRNELASYPLEKLSSSFKELRRMERKLSDLLTKNMIHSSIKDNRNLKSKMSKSFLDQLERALHWPVFFPHIISLEKGFDIIIGNPPYVRQEQITQLKPYLKTHYQTFDSIADLYVYFLERSSKILKNKGVLTYIVSNKWLRARYGENIRNFLVNEGSLIFLLDFDGVRLFEGANIETCILTWKKNKHPHKENYFLHVKSNDDPINLENLKASIQINGHLLRQGQLEKEWLLFPQEIIKIRKKIEKKGKPLKMLFPSIYRGIVTGLNEAFIINEETYLRLMDDNTKHLFKPLIRGKDINQRWQVKHDGEYLIYSTKTTIPDINAYPRIKEHFLKFRRKLLKMSHVKSELQKILSRKAPERLVNNTLTKLIEQHEDEMADLCHWWVLQDPKKIELFMKPKILYPDIAERPTVVFDDSGLVFNNTVYFITHPDPRKLLYLLGFLNSNVFEFYYKTVASKIGKKGYRFFTQFMEKTPLIMPHNIESNSFLNLIEKLIREKEKEQDIIGDIEETLNDWYYSLYDITNKERKILEQFIQSKE